MGAARQFSFPFRSLTEEELRKVWGSPSRRLGVRCYWCELIVIAGEHDCPELKRRRKQRGSKIP